ncbi:hypothetical protein [Ruegeria meonggei]
MPRFEQTKADAKLYDTPGVATLLVIPLLGETPDLVEGLTLINGRGCF